MNRIKEFIQKLFYGKATPLPVFYVAIAFMSEVSSKFHNIHNFIINNLLIEIVGMKGLLLKSGLNYQE